MMRLYGKNPVIERIKTDPGSIKRLYLQKRTELSDIVRETKKHSLDFKSVEKTEMDRLARGVHTQGALAEVKDYEYTAYPSILKDCLEEGIVPVFIDGVTDPQNFGAIIRTLACMGGFSIVIPEHKSVEVNETALRVASGGENYVKIAQVPNSVRAVNTAKEKGIWIAGAVAGEGKDIIKGKLKFPLAVVIGSEGKGIRPGLEKCLDAKLSLPMEGAELSYNVATATALFCYEVMRKKGEER